MNIINKRIVGLTIACLLLISIVSSGVFAYFFDIETSTNNTLAAGTLDMVPATSGTGPSGKYTVTGGGNGVNGNVVFTKMRPGESGTVTWVLTNNGSLPGTLTLPTSTTFAENGSNEIEALVSGNDGGGNGDLDVYLGVKLQRGTGTDQANAEGNFSYILGDAGNYVAISGLEAVLDDQSVSMAASGANDTVVYKLSWNIANPLAVNNNIIQSDSAQIDIAFALIQ